MLDLLQLLSDLSPRHAKNDAELPVNRPKNRYTNILPCEWHTSLSDESVATLHHLQSMRTWPAVTNIPIKDDTVAENWAKN